MPSATTLYSHISIALHANVPAYRKPHPWAVQIKPRGALHQWQSQQHLYKSPRPSLQSALRLLVGPKPSVSVFQQQQVEASAGTMSKLLSCSSGASMGTYLSDAGPVFSASPSRLSSGAPASVSLLSSSSRDCTTCMRASKAGRGMQPPQAYTSCRRLHTCNIQDRSLSG